MSRLEAQALRVRLGARTVLSRVSLEVEGGEMLGLIGPNGAGKTTLLRALAMLVSAEDGAILLDGKPLAALDAAGRARKIGYLAQDARPEWPVDVKTLVGLGRLPHLDPWRGPQETDRAAVAKAIRDCRLERLTDRPATALSGGERARVLLARVLAGAPEILLADEPTAGLDPAHQLDVMESLSRLAGAGVAVVVVMHDLTLAARFCSRLVLLHRGTVFDDGPATQVLSDRNLAEMFGIEVQRSRTGEADFVVPLTRIKGRGDDAGAP